MRYHLNKHGNPGPCKAMVQCPFGDMETGHYDSPEAARTAYEAQQGSAFTAQGKPVPYPDRIKAFVDLIPVAPDGTTFEDNWNAAFALTQEPAIVPVHDVVKKALKINNFGRERGTLTLARIAPSEFDPHDHNPKYPHYMAGLYPPDAAEAQDLDLVATIYTRNGGRNRECDCDNHDDGPCTGAVVEELQQHTEYMRDWDDTNDSTYATFMFRVEENAELQSAMANGHLAQQQRSQHDQLMNISLGYVSPLTVMPKNPATEAKLEAAFKNRRMLFQEFQRKQDQLNGLRPARLTDQDEDRFTALVKKPVVDWDEDDVKVFSRAAGVNPHLVQGGVDNAQKLDRIKTENTALIREIEAGTVPPAALARIGDAKSLAKEIRNAEASYKQRSPSMVMGMRYARLLKNHNERERKLTSQIAMLEDALHWPGDPKKMPSELKGEQ